MAQSTVRAQAHPNIALVKYWGKQASAENLPAVPSLSITLDGLTATTQVSLAAEDSFRLDGKQLTGANKDLKLARFLDYLREHHAVPPLSIDSSNNFPTAAGLASSAAGFAALVTAIDALCDLQLNTRQRSALARAGSASAARSVLGGFVGLNAPDFAATQLASSDHWPLQIAVAITDTQKKAVSSTRGMTISANTSPFYQDWVNTADADYERAAHAITQRDFEQLAEVSEHSCLKMHAVMQSSLPPLLYWNAASMACMHEIQRMREQGTEVFFTIDAGPQIKAVCTSASVAEVTRTLAEVPGVLRVEQVALGSGAVVVQ